MTSTAFWRAAAERAVRTFAQALIAVLGVGATSVLDVDWPGALSAAALAALLSLLTSVASSGVGDPGPSLGAETTEPVAVPDPESPTGIAAGEASNLPEGEPVEVIPADDLDADVGLD
mgnify:CR=1 FL=1